MRRSAAPVLGWALGLAALVVPVPVQASAPPACNGLPATVVGTDGADFLKGTDGDDVIVALGGNDVVRGGPGNDVVCGGRGHDHIRVTSGSDIVLGGPGGDRLEAFSRRPTQLRGGSGDDFLFLTITADPGYAVDGGGGHDIGDIRRDPGILGEVTLVVDRRAGTLSRAGELTGSYLGIEEVGFDELMSYEYRGTRAPDRVTTEFGQFPFTARTYGGKDVVVSSGGDDYIDVGRGVDRVDAGAGSDTCLHAERARGCETVTP